MKQRNTYNVLQRVIDRTIPKEYRPMVRQWLISGNNREEKDEALNQIWEKTSLEQDIWVEGPLKNTWKKIRTAELHAHRRLFLKRMLRYAAVFLLLVISGVSVWVLSDKNEVLPEMVECYVPNGKLQTVVLPDGSVVQVNAGSLFIYPSQFIAPKRQVYLSGEANFSVEKNPEKPFIVRTGDLNVEVLGTNFNIESYPGTGTITTTLKQGAVKVYKQDKPEEAIRMKPNEQVCYLAHENRFITSIVESSDYSAWTEGELRFINKSLDDILFTLERKYDVRFLVDTQIRGTDLYTMKFKAYETIEDVLYVLGELIGSISFQREGQTIRLDLKGKEVAR